MGTMQFRHVEPGPCGTFERSNEVRFHPVHVVARHFTRNNGIGQIRQRRRGDDFPCAFFQRLVDPLPGQFRRTLAPRVTDLYCHPGICAVMREIDDAFPLRFLLVGPDAGTTGGDPRIRRYTGHFRKDQPRPAHRAAGVMTEMPVVRITVDRAVLTHGRHHDAVGQPHVAQLHWRKHRRYRRFLQMRRIVPVRCLGREGFIDSLHEVAIPKTEVIVSDRLRPRHQAEIELNGIHIPVPPDILEPRQRNVGGVLGTLDLVTAVFIVQFQSGARIGFRLATFEQRDRVFHRQLGPRPNGIMRRMRAVAHDDDVVLDPGFTADHWKIPPHRPIGDDRVSVQQIFVQFGHVGDGVLFPRVFHARLKPRVFRGFDDHGAHFAVVLIGVEIPDSGVVLAKIERERWQRLGRTQPDELVGPPVEAGFEVIGIFIADPGIDPIGGQNHVGIGI